MIQSQISKFKAQSSNPGLSTQFQSRIVSSDDKVSLREMKSSMDRRKFVEDQLKIQLDSVSSFNFTEEEVKNKNIENLIGSVHIPLGVAGPLIVNKREYFIPLATTEGALVASISRGAKAVSLSLGVTSIDEFVGITRAPVFRVGSLNQADKAKKWILKNFKLLNSIAKKTSKHLSLLKVDFALSGKNLFVKFFFNTDEAMGMNMATIATELIVKEVVEKNDLECVSLAGNFDIDKKPAWLNFIQGRGRKVWAEAIIKKEIVESVLKTTPEKITDVVLRKSTTGSILSGSLGFNAHFANIIAAVYLATGQDLAHITEGSLGITSAEVLENGDLYFSVFLPAVAVGTVGGGTRLPTQREALEILNLTEKSKVSEFSRVIGASVLAGELSLTASLAEGTLACAHEKLGRGGKR